MNIGYMRILSMSRQMRKVFIQAIVQKWQQDIILLCHNPKAASPINDNDL